MVSEIGRGSVVKVGMGWYWPSRDRIGVVVSVTRDGGQLVMACVNFGSVVELKEETIPVEHLEVQQGWTSQARCDYLFGKNMTHSLYTIKAPFGPDSVCMHETHDSEVAPPKAERRIMMNAWGTVCEFDACERHVYADGYRLDTVPLSKRFRK